MRKNLRSVMEVGTGPDGSEGWISSFRSGSVDILVSIVWMGRDWDRVLGEKGSSTVGAG